MLHLSNISVSYNHTLVIENVEYHFPKKVKSTTAKNVTFSDDRKTIYISYPFEELLKNEKVLDFEVKF